MTSDTALETPKFIFFNLKKNIYNKNSSQIADRLYTLNIQDFQYNKVSERGKNLSWSPDCAIYSQKFHIFLTKDERPHSRAPQIRSQYISEKMNVWLFARRYI